MSIKTITATESLSLYDLDGLDLDQAVSYFQELRDKYAGNNARLDYSCNGDESDDFGVRITRPETEKEARARVADEERLKEYRRRQYDRLKKEFEEK